MHVRILDPLRGIAALMVVLFHYGCMLLPSIADNPLSPAFHLGKMGVQVFFVISGFVIPYALVRSGYTLKELGPFMLRRVIRIAPPAYVATALVVGLHLLYIAIIGTAPNYYWAGFGWKPIIGNIFFISEALDKPYYNFPYWSLEVEFQYYLVMGLILPLLIDKTKPMRTFLVLAAIVLLSWPFASAFFDTIWFFRYGGYFVLGIGLFLWREGFLPRRMFAALVLMVIALYVGKAEYFIVDRKEDYERLALAVATMLVIAWNPSIDRPWLNWLGRISYSLYITHIPVGVAAEGVLRRVEHLHDHAIGKLLLLVVYITIALVFASVFERLIERPCIAWAKRVGRGPVKPAL
jgi:peptidoglycan/LPS O-acetylase OafA/YrhL